MILSLAFSAAILLPTDPAPLHGGFDELLQRFVTADGVDYEAWSADPAATGALSDYVDRLATAGPGEEDRDAALAYWINLYNALTLELVLDHYPVDSIKDTAGFLRSPWKKDLVTVQGEELSLDAIEHDIIRARFGDARIHFAVNCASVGCPPLAREPYVADRLDEQLDAACRRTLNDPHWVRLEDDRLVVTKIFDWYREDFVEEAGSVVAFIARYRNDGDALLAWADDHEIEFADYDWSLNRAR